jgi:hypothetical protein
MFFLPGTSFAVSRFQQRFFHCNTPSLFQYIHQFPTNQLNFAQAILATPFFSQHRWMNEAKQIWIWVVLTIPSTILAFIFYAYWKRRQWLRKKATDKVENFGSRMSSISVDGDSDGESL